MSPSERGYDANAGAGAGARASERPIPIPAHGVLGPAAYMLAGARDLDEIGGGR